MNTISRKISGDLKVSLSQQAAERLNSYTPKGCPHSDYTLLDLLSDFIQLLQRERYAHAIVYGEDMMRIIEEV